ncbi:MAG: hypothetical protein AB7F89_20740 [Pirellulaceae bacterium]
MRRHYGCFALLLLGIGGTCQAEPAVLTPLGRHLGWGWSKGYHAGADSASCATWAAAPVLVTEPSVPAASPATVLPPSGAATRTEAAAVLPAQESVPYSPVRATPQLPAHPHWMAISPGPGTWPAVGARPQPPAPLHGTLAARPWIQRLPKVSGSPEMTPLPPTGNGASIVPTMSRLPPIAPRGVMPR